MTRASLLPRAAQLCRARPWIPLLALAALCGIGGGILLWAVAEWVPRLPFSANRPATFWETLRVHALFFSYLAVSLAGAAALLKSGRASAWSVTAMAAATLALSMAVRWSTPDMALDFAPRPDALHYSALAARLAAAGEWTIPVGPHDLPSRFSPATSLLMAPAAWLRPDHLGVGIWTIWLSSGLAIALLGFVGAKGFSPRVGWVAALLLASSPSFGHYSRQLMSEVPWSLFVLLALACLHLPRNRPAVVFSGGFLMAFGLLFKPPHVAIAFGAGLGYLLHVARGPANRWRNAFAAGLGFAAGLLPWLAYNRLVLGDWILSGYQIYDSNRYAVDAVFGVRYLFSAPIAKGVAGNLFYYPLAALGLDPRLSRMLFAFPVAALLLAGLFDRVRRRPRAAAPMRPESRSLLWSCALAAAAYLAMFMLYYWQDTRFLLPVLPPACLLAAVAVDPFVERIGARGQRLALGLLLVLLLPLGAATFHVEREGRRPHNHALWSRLPDALADFDVLVTDEDPVALGFHGIWTADRPVVPAMPPDADWYDDDPRETRRQTGAYQTPFVGLPNALRPHLDANRRIAAWFAFPHSAKKWLAVLAPDFVLVPWAEDVPNGYVLVRAADAPARKEEPSP